MHDTAHISGDYFSHCYSKPGMTIIDMGGRNINGTLRDCFPDCKYISVDIEAGHGVDLIVPVGELLPFEDGSIDIIVSSSCFEHDPCFWVTFKELCRVVKIDGFIYMSAPANGPYHKHPGDNWRFYRDAGQALAYWSTQEMGGVRPVKVEEVFFLHPVKDVWIDFVCIWRRINMSEKVTEIVTPELPIGPLRKTLDDNGYTTKND